MRIKLGTAYGHRRNDWTVEIPDGATVVDVRPDENGGFLAAYFLPLPDPPAPPYDPHTSDASGYTGAFSIEDALPEDVP